MIIAEITLMILLWFVVVVIVAAAVWAGANYLIEKCPWLPADWKPSVKYVMLLILVIVALWYLISLIPGSGVGPIQIR